jgi:lipopolysaccharide transport system permease protein
MSTKTDFDRPGSGFELGSEPTPVRVLVRDVWRYRHLLAILARKDFFVKFRRASLGMTWAVVLPLVQALVMALVLGKFIKFKTSINYPVFVFAGTVVWVFFSSSIVTGAGSIVDAHDLSTKVYFPRALFPLVSVGANLYGGVASTVVLVALALGEGVNVSFRILYIVPGLLLAVALASGFSLVLAVMQVYFRDMRYVVSAATTAWVYGTPVFYKLSLVGRLGPWLRLNPVTGLVELYRAAFGAADSGWGVSVAWTGGWIAALFVVAALLYRRYDRICTDLL